MRQLLASGRDSLHDGEVAADLCDFSLQQAWQLNAAGQWPFTFDKIGRWWDSHTEIDLVAFDSQGEDIIFGECKFWTGPVGVNVLTALEEKAKAVDWKEAARREHFVLFSINGFTEDLMALSEQRDDLTLCD